MSVQNITLGVQIDRFTANTINNELSNSFVVFQSTNDFSIKSSLLVGDIQQLFVSFDIPSIESTTTISSVEVLNFVDVPSINSTLSFDPPTDLDFFFNIESLSVTTSVSVDANVFVSIGPPSIEQTTLFGNFDKPRPVHRSLIFKNDNITKLGGNDDVEIASNIILKSSTAKLTGDTLPGTTAGFVIVTIDGIDYKMPFFNL